MIILHDHLPYFPWESVLLAFATPPKLLKRAVLPAPTQLPLNPPIKDTDTQFNFLVPFDTIAGCYLSPAWKSVPLSILSSAPPTCPNFSYFSPGYTPLITHLYERPVRAACAVTSGQLFSIRSKANSVTPLPVSLPCLQGSGSPAYSILPAIGQWLLY